MNDQDAFKKVRALFPHAPKTVYFNAASYGPFARTVSAAISENLDLRMKARRDDSHDAFDNSAYLRKAYAKLIGASQDEVGIGLNTTHGINIAAFGLPLKRGDEIICSDVEFPAIIYTWREAARLRGLKIKQIPSVNRCFDLDILEKAISRRTRVVCVSWVQFFNGYKVDLKDLSEICRRHDLFLVVDGIQGMGVEPLNLRRLGVDIFASGCQKWMLSPQGCGFFYLSDRVRDKLSLPFVSWLAADWKVQFTDLFRYNLPISDAALSFEMGYYVTTNLIGMRAAVAMFESLGVRNIQKHNYALIDRLAAYIEQEPFYTITSSMEKAHRSSIFTFSCNDVEKLHHEILKAGIVLVQREGSVRASVHLYNNERDIDRLITVLKRFAQ
ncbi:MAG TPA: aminotransferase class V-fold PLP-dependent enzyme [candidate division Zixibacteria bacterium]|nr:aminotransferase class V-fold PLP-dependent enzyme [candidate division Zixibacteria bacterium]